MRLAFLVATFAAVALLSASAAARDPVAAEALFREGRAAVGRGDWASACEKFGESQRLDPAPGTLINLGDCEDRLGLYASAWAHYHEAADALGGDTRLAMVKRKMDSLEPRLSRLTLELAPGAPAGTTVTRDGEPLGPATYGVALPVDRGAHQLVVSARGREPARLTIEVGTGEAKTVTVAPGPPLPPSAAPVAPPPDAGPGSAGMRAAGFVVGALGVASLGAGAATGIMTIQRKGTVEQSCNKNKECTPAGVQAATEGKTLAAVSTATFVAGLAGLGAGVAMVVTGSRSRGPVVSAALGPGGAGVWATGTF